MKVEHVLLNVWNMGMMGSRWNMAVNELEAELVLDVKHVQDVHFVEHLNMCMMAL